MSALLWRELKVSLGSIFGFISQFLTPVFLLLFFATTFSKNVGISAMNLPGISYLEFFTPGLFGYVTFLLLTISFALTRIDTRTGMLSIIALSQTSLSGYYWTKFIVHLILSAIKIVILVAITVLITKHLPQFTMLNFILFLYALIISVAIWYSLGFISGVFITRDDLREIILMLITLPLTFSSSMYYNINVAPQPIRWLAQINPLTYSCNIFRGCYLNMLPEDFLRQVVFLSILAVVLISLSILSLRRIKFQ